MPPSPAEEGDMGEDEKDRLIWRLDVYLNKPGDYEEEIRKIEKQLKSLGVTINREDHQSRVQ